MVDIPTNFCWRWYFLSPGEKMYSKLVNILLFIILMFTIAWVLNFRVLAEPQSPFPGTEVQTRYFQGYDAYLDSKINVTTAGRWDMENTINENDVVLWVEVSPENVSVGDIIYYENPSSPGDFTAHRVIGIENNTFHTQGDASSAPDPYTVSPAQLRGLVIGVIYSRSKT